MTIEDILPGQTLLPPETVTLRPAVAADASALAAAKIAIWRECYRGILPPDALSALDCDMETGGWRDALEHNPGNWRLWLAMADGQVAGYCRAGQEGGLGEIHGLYVQSTCRGRRIGRRLLVEAAEWLMSGGGTEIALWCLAGNIPAQRFYRKLGGREAGHRLNAYGSHPMAEVGFVWHRPMSLWQACLG